MVIISFFGGINVNDNFDFFNSEKFIEALEMRKRTVPSVNLTRVYFELGLDLF